jgi:hypothetical protein
MVPADFRNILRIHGQVFLAQLLLLILSIGAYVYLLQVKKPMEHCAPWASSVEE